MASIGIILGCTSKDDAASQRLEIMSSEIAQGILSGAGEENIPRQNLVISDQESWDLLKAQMNTVNNETKNFSQIEINFSTEIIIASFDEVRGSGGYRIEIVNLAQEQNEIVATIRHTEPEGFVTTAITQPYHIIKVQTASHSVRFE